MTLTERINRMAERLGISADDFKLFSTVKCLEDLENLERIVADPDMRDQLKDVVELHRLGRMDAAALAREVEELLSMPQDATWTPEID